MTENKINIFYILMLIMAIRPVLFTNSPDIVTSLIASSDSQNHIEYAKFLFFDGPPIMQGYPKLMHTILYALSFGNETNLASALVFLAIISMILYRTAIIYFFSGFNEKVQFALSFLVLELPYFLQWFVIKTTGAMKLILSPESMVIFFGTLPSFISLSLAIFTLNNPVLFVLANILVRFMSNSGLLIFLVFSIFGFIKTRNPIYLFSFVISPTSLISNGALFLLSGVYNNRILVNLFPFVAIIFFVYLLNGRRNKNERSL